MKTTFSKKYSAFCIALIICPLMMSIVFAQKITYGSLITVEATDVLDTNIFTVKPKITGKYANPVNGKNKNAKLKIINKINKKNHPSSIDAEWKKKVKLTDSKKFSDTETAFKNLENVPNKIVKCQMDFNGVSNKTLYIFPPEISGIYNNSGTTIVSAAEAGAEIVIKGLYFGTKTPKVFLEYADSKGKIKRVKCKVNKNTFIYKNAKGKLSPMSADTGESQISVNLPEKFPWGNDTKNHNIVLQNKLGVATVIFSIGKEKEELDKLDVPDGFNYETVKSLPSSDEYLNTMCLYNNKNNENKSSTIIKGKLVTEDGIIISNALISFMDGSNIVSSTSSDSNGMYEVALILPSDREEVYARYYYGGAIDGIYIDLQTESETPASNPADFDDPLDDSLSAFGLNALGDAPILPPKFYFMGNGTSGFNEVGVPDYLDEREEIDSSFLNDVNESLPQARPLQKMHPEYLSNGLEANTLLTSNADVWITLLYDGSAQCDSLGYFTYQSTNPPVTPDDIVSNIIVFPNVQSYYRKRYDKGGLYSGDKVYIGRFKAGTAIGYFIIRRGWWYIRGKAVDTYATTGEPIIYYSIPALNARNYTNIPSKFIKFPITTNFWKHSVLLYYPELKREVLSIETKPQYHWKADVNDAIFYVDANPPDAIDTNNIPVTKKFIDSDNDGISDTFDSYPNDAKRAFNNYYPAQNRFATLAFEDNWPKKGDYDMNDLVIQYNIKYVTDAKNKVKDIFPHFKIVAVGAGNYNGFGFELGTTPDNIISNVNNLSISNNYIHLNPNNTEAGQEKATIIVFDSVYDMFPLPASFINTESNMPYVEPTEIEFAIHLDDSVSKKTLGNPPYNPFMIANFKNKGRTNEIHLSGYKPTSLAIALGITNLFGTKDDDSSVSAGKYYLTDKNLPWVLNIPAGWNHNYENENILKSYLKFGTVLGPKVKVKVIEIGIKTAQVTETKH